MVGFPRSGTTLAQSIVMCDSQVFSIPETHLFTRGNRFKGFPERLSNLWLAWYCYRWIRDNFSENYIFYSSSKENMIKSFFIFLEEKAAKEGKSIILEKTPGHLAHIEYISSIFEESSFIHVTRSYNGAVPSIVKAAKHWGGDTDSFSNMKRWVAEVFTSTYYSNKFSNHVLVDYEGMVAGKESVIDTLNNTLDLNITTVTEDKLALLSKKIVQENEIWKENNIRGHRKVVKDPILDFEEPLKQYIKYLNSNTNLK